MSLADPRARRRVLRARHWSAPLVAGSTVELAGRAAPVAPLRTPFGGHACVLFRIAVYEGRRLLGTAGGPAEMLLETRGGIVRVDSTGALLRTAPERARVPGAGDTAALRTALRAIGMTEPPVSRWIVDEAWIPSGVAVFACGYVVERAPVVLEGYRSTALRLTLLATELAAGRWSLGDAEPHEATGD